MAKNDVSEPSLEIYETPQGIDVAPYVAPDAPSVEVTPLIPAQPVVETAPEATPEATVDSAVVESVPEATPEPAVEVPAEVVVDEPVAPVEQAAEEEVKA
jgi:hypothetical protein